MQIIIAWIIVITYIFCFFFVFAMTIHSAITENWQGIGWLAGCGFFISIAFRNWKVFVISMMTFSPDVMFSNYQGAICAIVFTGFVFRFRNSENKRLKAHVYYLETELKKHKIKA